MEDEFQKWLINKQSETYFLNLENLLSSSLNLANERLKGYSLGNIQDSYELIYLYRLPWLLHVNDE